MSQSKELVLKYEGETYSLLEIPKSTTQLVIEAKGRMMQIINLPQLAKDLTNLGMFLRLAFNGVVGYIELQTKVRKIFYDVVRLCDESIHTVNEFQRASTTAVESLQATYEYLVDGLDDLAIVNLEEIKEVAGKMKVAAEKLSKEFRNEADAVKLLEKETSQTESKTKQSSKDKEEQKRQAQIEKEKQKKLFEDMVQDEIRSEREYEEARRKEMKEIQNQKLGFFKGLVNVLVTDSEGKGMFEADREAAKQAAEIHGKEKEKFYNDMIKARVQRRLALEQMASFAKKMEQLGEESQLESAAAESLHHAATALVSLADIMEKASRFWEETKGICEELSSPKIVKLIKNVSQKDEEERRKTWDNRAFKLSGIRYYCSWIAIKEICEVCRGGIEIAQRSVHVYIRDNPTQEEARLTVKQLAPELDQIIKEDLDALKRNKLAIEN